MRRFYVWSCFVYISGYKCMCVEIYWEWLISPFSSGPCIWSMSQISDCFPLLPELNDIHIIFRLLGVEVLETVLTGQKRRGDEVQCLSPLSSCLSLSSCLKDQYPFKTWVKQVKCITLSMVQASSLETPGLKPSNECSLIINECILFQLHYKSLKILKYLQWSYLSADFSTCTSARTCTDTFFFKKVRTDKSH